MYKLVTIKEADLSKTTKELRNWNAVLGACCVKETNEVWIVKNDKGNYGAVDYGRGESSDTATYHEDQVAFVLDFLDKVAVGEKFELFYNDKLVTLGSHQVETKPL